MDLSSIVLSYLANVSVRSLSLLAIAAAAVCACRVKSPSTKHVVWTLGVVGMLLLAILGPLAPAIPLRILPEIPEASIPIADVAAPSRAVTAAPAAVAPAAPEWKPSWSQAILIVYLLGVFAFLARFLVGYLFTRRLVQASIPVGRAILPAAAFQAADPAADFRESTWISAPMTVGWIRPKVLLPTVWREWEEAKLQAVLAHELAHVRRADWLVAALASLNRSLFWFHPLAWWLESRLSTLAEQACDDAALLALGDREQYASALLDMARAVKSARSRLVWHAVAMAEPSEVGSRIDRILDETRPIPRGLTRARRWAVAFCSLPLLYVVSALQLAPPEVMGQEARVTLPAYDDPFTQWLIQGNQLTAADAERLERTLAANPEDLEARGKVLAYYQSNGVREPRLTHIWWMIEHHPESPIAGYASSGISQRVTRRNNSADYDWTRFVWLRQTAQFSNDPRVLANAVRFFSPPNNDFAEAERLLKSLRSLQPNEKAWPEKLAELYVTALIYTVVNPSKVFSNLYDPSSASARAFAERIKQELEVSTDGPVVARTGSLLAARAKLWASAFDPNIATALTALANRLSQRSLQFGVQTSGAGEALSNAQIRPVEPKRSRREEVDSSLREREELELLKREVELYRQLIAQLVAQAEGQSTTSSKASEYLQQQLKEAQYKLRQADVRLHVAEQQPKLIQVKQEVERTRADEQQLARAVEQLHEAEAQMRAQAGVSAQPAPHPQRIRVGGVVQARALIEQVAPVYPDAAKQEGIEGTVRCNVVIGKDGKVLNVQVVKGHPVLAEAARAAISQWVYQPTLLNDQPVEVTTVVDLNFELDQ